MLHATKCFGIKTGYEIVIRKHDNPIFRKPSGEGLTRVNTVNLKRLLW